MRWLIVEDALRDRTGHWFEYISTFWRELPQLGDELTILADQAAEPFLLKELSVLPVLPPSIWHRMSVSASAVRRYLRVPLHAWLTRRAMRTWLESNTPPDVIFVPTVIVHHLLAWVSLIKGPLRRTPSQVLLFFPLAPIRIDPASGEASWVPAPTSTLFALLIRLLKGEVERGRVILGVETFPMSDALTHITGVPFKYFPHPVTPLPENGAANATRSEREIVMASYGGARREKGDDVLIRAIDEYGRRFVDSRARFVFQCVGGNARDWQSLQGRANVELIADYFAENEYSRSLQKTQVMLLPYRRASYGLRVSRVAVEAMVNGIPIVTTRGTTLDGQSADYGAAVLAEDGDVESLVQAIRECELRYEELRQLAGSRVSSAREHFSVAEFRRSLRHAPEQGLGKEPDRITVESER